MTNQRLTPPEEEGLWVSSLIILAFVTIFIIGMVWYVLWIVAHH